MIPKDVSDAKMDYVNLLTNHGKVDLDIITKFDKTYIRKELRAAQDTSLLYHCLMNPLSKIGKDKVSVWNSQYKVNILPSGNLLLEFIIWEIHLDTNATTTSIRTQLSSLDAYIENIGCNITKFNAHVELLLSGLSERGETSNDMLNNIFKRYKSASDSVFVKYIERKKDIYKDGQDLTPTALVLLSYNKLI